MPVRRPPPPEIEAILTNAAQQAGIPPALLISVAHVESRYDPAAVNPGGAMGLMQLMPKTAETFGVTDPFDPEQSARAGAQFLARLFARYGDWPTALAAYNWGPGNVKRRPNPEQWPTATRLYITKVLNTPIDPQAAPQPIPRPKPASPWRKPRTPSQALAKGYVVAAMLAFGFWIGINRKLYGK